MEIKYRNKIGTIEKRKFYCSAGKYENKYRDGWVLVVDGKVELGDSLTTRHGSGMRDYYEYPVCRTRKSLVEWIGRINEIYEKHGMWGALCFVTDTTTDYPTAIHISVDSIYPITMK